MSKHKHPGGAINPDNIPDLDRLRQPYRGSPPYKTFNVTKDWVCIAAHHRDTEKKCDPTIVASDIITPDGYENAHRSPLATVLAVGPDVKSVKEGDIVVAGQGVAAGMMIWHEDMCYILIQEQFVGGILDKTLKCNQKHIKVSEASVREVPSNG